MLPESTYRAVVVDHGWGTSTNGKTQLALCFKVLEGPQAGQTITDYKYFSGKAAEFTLKALRACGWKGDDLENLGKLDQAVDIVIEHEPYEDKVQAKVKWVNSPGGTVALKDPLSKDALRMFAASMKAQAASIKEVDGPKVDASQTQAPAEPPFEGPPPSDAPPPDDAHIPWE